MITFSEYMGNTYSPTTSIECLSSDILFLPRNRKNEIVEDIFFNYSTNAQVSIKTNTFLHKIYLGNVPSNISHFEINDVIVLAENNDKTETLELKYNKEQFKDMPFVINKRVLTKNRFDISTKRLLIDELNKAKKINNILEKIAKITLKIILYSNDTISNEISLEIKIDGNHNIINDDNYFYDNFDKFYIGNGSIAFCMDTTDVYKFDEEYDRWLKI